jgi:hypothetical protein
VKVALGGGTVLRQLHDVHKARRLQEAKHKRSSNHFLQPHSSIAGCLGGARRCLDSDSRRLAVLVVVTTVDCGGNYVEAC